MFESYISLGYYCGVAASLAKHGFRSFSGPFDWCFSDLGSIIQQIDKNFTDFMIRANLKVLENNPKQFIDTKYGFHFNHDVKVHFETEYEKIQEKYKRRTQKFITTSHSPTCFLRAVENSQEISYIHQNEAYITTVIKKNNPKNEIIFLVPPFIEHSDLEKTKFKHFELNITEYHTDTKQNIQKLFDNTIPLLEYLHANYPIERKLCNQDFIQNKLIEFYKNKISEYENRYNQAINLLNTDFDKDTLPQKVIIYGAGKLGRALHKKIKDFCEVECFVETNPTQKYCDGKKIYSLQDIPHISCKNYIITPTQHFNSIAREITKRTKNNICLISLDDILPDYKIEL